MAIHLYKTSTPITRNGTVVSQVKSNPRNNLIYGHHHCGKGCNAIGIITARHRVIRSECYMKNISQMTEREDLGCRRSVCCLFPR